MIPLAEMLQSRWCSGFGAGTFSPESHEGAGSSQLTTLPPLEAGCPWSVPHYLQTVPGWTCLLPFCSKKVGRHLLTEANEEIKLRGDSTLVRRKLESRKVGANQKKCQWWRRTQLVRVNLGGLCEKPLPGILLSRGHWGVSKVKIENKEFCLPTANNCSYYSSMWAQHVYCTHYMEAATQTTRAGDPAIRPGCDETATPIFVEGQKYSSCLIRLLLHTMHYTVPSKTSSDF